MIPEDIAPGSVITYKYYGQSSTGGVFRGTVEFIGDEVICISGNIPEQNDWKAMQKRSKAKGMYFYKKNIKIIE